MIASLGAVRTPLPKRSMNLEPNTCCQLTARAARGLLKVDIPYPTAMSHLRFPILSENHPEKTLSRLAVDSAMPSMRPMTDLFTPRTLARKRGTRGYIISELMSMKKLTSPAMVTFLPKPKNLLSATTKILHFGPAGLSSLPALSHRFAV